MRYFNHVSRTVRGRAQAVQAVAGILMIVPLLVLVVSCTSGYVRTGYKPQPALGDTSGAGLEARNLAMASREARTVSVTYSIEEAGNALAAMFADVELIHPNHLFNFPDAERYELFKSDALSWLDTLSQNGRVSDIDLALVLYYCMAAFGDGHSAPQLHWQSENFSYRASAWPPFVLAVKDGEYLVSAVDGESVAVLPQGSVVKSIEGQSVRDFLAPVFLAIPAENQVWRDYVFTRQQNFFYSLLDLFKDRTSLHIGLADGREVTVPCINGQQFAALVQGNAVVSPANGSAGDAWSEPARAIVYFSYASFRTDQASLERIDQVFRFAADRQARHLIIDLRRNGGGNSRAGDYLIDYFFTGQYRQFRKVVARYSAPVMQEQAFTPEMIGGQPGSLVVYEGGMNKANNRQPFFRGTVHVITGPGTFSSATDFAATVQDFGMGELWGYETGGVRSCHGDVFSRILPVTGWPIGVSWKTFYAPVERPDEMTRGVMPDHLATPEMLEPYADQADPLLAWMVAELGDRE